MLALRDHQRAIAAGLLTGETAKAASLIADGCIPPADRLRIHRNTMLTGLINALALTYPAVEALVGSEFFAQTARIFVLANPPRVALLTGYGAGFPDFLAGYSQSLRYLPDVGRLEWAVDQAAREPADAEAPPCADVDLGGTRLRLAPSLSLLRTRYPAEPIWRAVLDADGDGLSRIDTEPGLSIAAIWRGGDGAAVTPVGTASAAFLEDLLSGGDAESAINAAAAAEPEGDPIAAITKEILPAGFVRLTPR